MDMINWMAIGNETDNICHITGLISRYYRTMLNHGESYTTLENELNNIQSYIGIQLLMHNDSFDVQYECDPQLLQNTVLNFILQPAVENALKHGINALTGKRGFLRIVVQERNGCILIDVCDNGPGLTPEQQQTLNQMLMSDSKNNGYGLRNVQERIQLAFGPEYGLTLSGKPNEGCVTRFYLPLFHLEDIYEEGSGKYGLGDKHVF